MSPSANPPPSTSYGELPGTVDAEQVYADEDGTFRRPDSVFRSWVSPDPGARFAAEKGRYVLYLTLSCPWAHRTNLVRSLKGLESIIDMVVLDPRLFPGGWKFTGLFGTNTHDPIYNIPDVPSLYQKASPGYSGRCSVPVLWDTKHATIVNNESADIIQMFYTAFDALLPPSAREPAFPLRPAHLVPEIDALNTWIYSLVNNGVYKTGFATAQPAYEDACRGVFAGLDRLEALLGDGRRYLTGETLTDADIRLFPTVVRFDTAYFTMFKCNLRMIRYAYPRLQRWLVGVWYDERVGRAFRETTKFQQFKIGYAGVVKAIVPLGPVPDMMPKESGDE